MKNKVWSWKTYEGKIVTLDEIDHQHFSNLYWHNLLITGRDLKKERVFQEALKERFDDELLEYRPPIDFKYEINFLKAKGHLHRDADDPTKINVVYKGKIVGYVI